MDKQSEYLTSHRAARILQITKRTLNNWVRSGKVPAPFINPANRYMQWTLPEIDDIRRQIEEESRDSTGNR